jgi:hypothetical protein
MSRRRPEPWATTTCLTQSTAGDLSLLAKRPQQG